MADVTPAGREHKVHLVKVWPDFFDRLIDGSKTFEVRKDDRGYQRGDVLILREWNPHRWLQPDYTGRELRAEIGFIFHAGFGVDLGPFVVLSLLNVGPIA